MRVFNSGFETGQAQAEGFDTVTTSPQGGPPTIVTTNPRTGARALLINANLQYVSRTQTFVNGVEYRFRICFQKDAHPTGLCTIARLRTVGGGATNFFVVMNTSGQIYLAEASGGQLGSASAVLANGAYHVVEVAIRINAISPGTTNGYLALRVNDTDVSEFKNVNANTTAGIFDVGNTLSTSPGTNIYIDDVAINDDIADGPTNAPGTALGSLGNAAAQTALAQQWAPAETDTLDSVRLAIGKVGAPADNLYVEFCTDSGGSPGTVLATSNVVAASALTVAAGGGTQPITFSFPSPPQVVGNLGTYWIVLRRDGAVSGTNYFTWGGYASDVYAGGSAKAYTGSAWSTVSGISDFRWVTPGFGTIPNSWPGDGKLAFLPPTADNNRGTWTDNAGGTFSIFDGIDNQPPIGEGPLRNSGTAFISGAFSTPVYTASTVANGAITAALPTGYAVGDILLLFAWTESIAATAATPAGWTLLTGFPIAHTTANGGKLYVFAKIATGSDAATAVTWSGLTATSTGTPAGVSMCAVGNVSYGVLADMIVGTPSVSRNAASKDIATAALTGVAGQSNNLMFAVGINPKATPNTTAEWTNGVFTERLDSGTLSGGDMSIYVGTKAQGGSTQAASTVTGATANTSPNLAVSFLLVSADRTVTAKSQIKTPSTSSNADYDATLATYDSAGITVNHEVRLVQPVAQFSNPAAATAATQAVSNPADTMSSATPSPSFTDPGATPTGWGYHAGRVTYMPSVALSTAPVLRFRHAASSAVVTHVDMLGMYVEYDDIPVTPAALSLSAAAASSGAASMTVRTYVQFDPSDASSTSSTSLALTIPSAAAPLTLATATATSNASAAITAKTQVALASAAATSNAALALTAPTRVAVAAAAATSNATIALTAPARVPLVSAAAVSDAAAVFTTSLRVPLAAAAATSSATLAVTAQTRVTLAASAATSDAALGLRAPTRIALAGSVATSSATASITITTTIVLAGAAATSSASITIIPRAAFVLSASATSTAAAAFSARALLSLASSATSTGSIALTSPTGIPLVASSATSTASVAFTARTIVALGAAAATSSATLTLRVKKLLRPNTDVSGGWQTNAGSHYGALDDAVEQPTAPATDSDFVYAAAAAVDRIGFEDVSTSSTVGGALWVYAQAGSALPLTVELYSGATLVDSFTLPSGTPAGWQSIPFSGLTQAEVNALELKLVSG